MKATWMAAVGALAMVVGLGAAEAAGFPKAKPVQGVLNLNTASSAQLELLPGVGKKTAGLILAYRAKQPFRSPEELDKVKGIGPATMKRVRPHIAVSGPTTLVALAVPAKQAPPKPSTWPLRK